LKEIGSRYALIWINEEVKSDKHPVASAAAGQQEKKEITLTIFTRRKKKFMIDTVW